MRQFVVTAIVAATFQTALADLDIAHDNIPQGRTVTSPVATQYVPRQIIHKRLQCTTKQIKILISHFKGDRCKI